ncbi:anthranilate phosphoribosyltransferase [Capsulimonas corticalis]|uniref:Anthranilate phosphoribosyltransferase n=1 Tax=Capsulimonas corticalis TaxID=2219043 RepID=A0A402D2G9_9BACT|nr:anthranilate phosphoribosyltransferase [Capsulimonas corticalis]BDI30015.1 anthranilate phosphoribosyltransferase [Capsulimonas corticalis]
MKHAIQKLIDRQDLTEEESASAMTQIMEGAATPAQIAALAVALRAKGESIAEITGFARVMREYAVQVPVQTDKVIVDTCGTGGDSLKTFNISTAAALVVAADGRLAVAKHGNRAATSKCGSADVLEALGVKLDLPPHDVGRCVEEVGIGFLFAPSMHPSFKYAAGPRREIGIRTIFNMLGPLTNPAGASVQLIGVYDGAVCETLAHVLRNLGSQRALLVHGLEGLDELSTLGKTAVSELKDGEVRSYILDADTELGLPIATIHELAASDTPEDNARILLGVLRGEDRGPRREIALLNAAGVLMVGGVVESLSDGVARAGELIDSGAAQDALERLREFTNG